MLEKRVDLCGAHNLISALDYLGVRLTREEELAILEDRARLIDNRHDSSKRSGEDRCINNICQDAARYGIVGQPETITEFEQVETITKDPSLAVIVRIMVLCDDGEYYPHAVHVRETKSSPFQWVVCNNEGWPGEAFERAARDGQEHYHQFGHQNGLILKRK